MEKERGSLNDRLKGFGAEPDPALLLRLQEELAAQRSRRKRPLIWWFAAGLLLTGAFLSGWYLSENPGPRTGAAQKPAELPAKIEQAPKTVPAPHASVAEKPGGPESSAQEVEPAKRIPEKTSPAELAEGTENQNRPGSSEPEQANTQANSKPRKENPSKPHLVFAGPLVKQPMSKHPNPKAGDRIRQPLALVSEKKTNSSSDPEAATSDPQIVQSEKNQTSEAEKQPMVAPVLSSEEPGKTATANTPVSEKALVPQAPVDPRDNAQETGERNGQSTESKPIASDNPTASPAQGRSDSAQNQKTLAGTPPVDSLPRLAVQDSATRKPKENRTWLWAFSGGGRYSAQRLISVGVPSAEQRLTLQDAEQPFPARFAFELQGRLAKKISNRMELFTALQLGYHKEMLHVEVAQTLSGQYQFTTSGNDLVVRPVEEIRQSRWTTEQLFAGLQAGLGFQIPGIETKIRFGYGLQMHLWENHNPEGSGTGDPGYPGKVLPWVSSYRVSAEKTLWVGRKGKLSVEPLLVVYPKTQMEWGNLIQMRTLQSGFQINWNW